MKHNYHYGLEKKGETKQRQIYVSEVVLKGLCLNRNPKVKEVRHRGLEEPIIL